MSRDDKDLVIHLPLFANNVSFERKPIFQSVDETSKDIIAGYEITLTAVNVIGRDVNDNNVPVNIMNFIDPLVKQDLEQQIAEWYD